MEIFILDDCGHHRSRDGPSSSQYLGGVESREECAKEVLAATSVRWERQSAARKAGLNAGDHLPVFDTLHGRCDVGMERVLPTPRADA